MRYFTLALIFMFLAIDSSSQGIYELSNHIKSICDENPSNLMTNSMIPSVYSLEESLDTLLKRTDLKNSRKDGSELMDSLENISNYEALHLLRKEFEAYVYENSDITSKSQKNIYQYGLENNLEILDEMISRKIEKRFQLYDFTETSDRAFKSFHVYHDNDVFMFSDVNADRDYTGGFRLELTTDKLKMRLFKKFFNNDEILSYQSFIFGGEGYTPYIRFETSTLGENIDFDPESGFLTDTGRVMLSDSLSMFQERTDRPFASFQYIGRAKYRMNFKGHVRSSSFFKLGIVGGGLGEDVQKVLHQDLITTSVRVLNWDRQIANGGRMAFNIEHNVDFMLLSPWATIFNKNRDVSKAGKANNLNIYLPTEWTLGNVNTHYGFGLGISNKSFLQTNAHDDLAYKRELVDCGKVCPSFGRYLRCVAKRIWNHTLIRGEIRSRRVVHNSMLHGLGIINRWDDDPADDEAPSVYFLSEDNTADWLHYMRLTVAFRLKKATLYYKHTRLLNREFVVKDEVPERDEYTTPKFYGWGTIGLNIMI